MAASLSSHAASFIGGFVLVVAFFVLAMLEVRAFDAKAAKATEQDVPASGAPTEQ